MSAGKLRNQRLAEAMARTGKSAADLAPVAQVDPRTIDRWVADSTRMPRAESRHALAAALETPAGVLWPDAPNGTSVTNELVAIYPSRAAVPTGLVMSLLRTATQQIDVLALAAVWLWDTVPDFGPALAAKAQEGVRVRMCLGDPSGESVRIRGVEESIDGLLGARCQLSVTYARRFLDRSVDAIRLHDTTLYASILRFDVDLLTNWHLFGAPASEAPVLHLRRNSTYGISEKVAESFERVWEKAQPLSG